MKTIIGVDVEGGYSVALRLLSRINFQDNEVHLLHSVEGANARTNSPSPLTTAEECAKGLGIPCESHLESGPAAQVLTTRAHELGVDLIAIGASQKTSWRSAFLGSVMKGVTHASRRSVLVARDSFRREGGLTAVFATDHSGFCKGCLERLIALKPEGISHVIVLHALGVSTIPQCAEIVVPSVESSPEYEGQVQDENNAIVAFLEGAGISAEGVISLNSPNDAIAEVMKEQKADLLILGSGCRSFWEHLLGGNVVETQANRSNYSVLILRTPKPQG